MVADIRPVVALVDAALDERSAAPIEWGQASDDRLAAENRRLRLRLGEGERERDDLRRRVAEVTRERDGLGAALEEEERAREREQAVHGLAVRAIFNPWLKTESRTLVRTIFELHRADRDPKVDARGWVDLPMDAIGDPDWNATRGDPVLRGRNTVARHLRKAVAWGLLERRVVTVVEEVEEVDPGTGEIRRSREPTKVNRVRRTGTLAEMLEKVATFQRPSPSNHGGPRPCRPRGATPRVTDDAPGGCGAPAVGSEAQAASSSVERTWCNDDPGAESQAPTSPEGDQVPISCVPPSPPSPPPPAQEVVVGRPKTDQGEGLLHQVRALQEDAAPGNAAALGPASIVAALRAVTERDGPGAATKAAVLDHVRGVHGDADPPEEAIGAAFAAAKAGKLIRSKLVNDDIIWEEDTRRRRPIPVAAGR